MIKNKTNTKTYVGHRLRVRKSLGQNFLKSALALRKIVEAGRLEAGELVLEIGPGKGALTSALLATGARVLAVEKDPELFEFLRVKFEKEIKSRTLVLILGDILELDISETVSKLTYVRHRFSFGSLPQPDHAKNSKQFRYKIISNIPYNITGAILKKFLTDGVQPSLMVLMVQHEVAKRVMASDGKESLLSISVKAYGRPKMILKVPARYFSPAPKVDSAVIAIYDISRELFTQELVNLQSEQDERVSGGGVNEEKFWQIVKAGFAHKRKKLSSNLRGVCTCQREPLTLLGSKRAEDLTLQDWVDLTSA
jgi:16S rRNA (adenine1518-N6/adenine1519-N6)-dimethyltransferase